MSILLDAVARSHEDEAAQAKDARMSLKLNRAPYVPATSTLKILILMFGMGLSAGSGLTWFVMNHLHNDIQNIAYYHQIPTVTIPASFQTTAETAVSKQEMHHYPIETVSLPTPQATSKQPTPQIRVDVKKGNLDHPEIIVTSAPNQTIAQSDVIHEHDVSYDPLNTEKAMPDAALHDSEYLDDQQEGEAREDITDDQKKMADEEKAWLETLDDVAMKSPQDLIIARRLEAALKEQNIQRIRKKQPHQNHPQNLKNVMRYYELPEEIRASLPNMNVNVHNYVSNSKKSFLIINDQEISEGQEISQDLTLIKVRQRDAVLRYQGILFSINAFAHL